MQKTQRNLVIGLLILALLLLVGYMLFMGDTPDSDTTEEETTDMTEEETTDMTEEEMTGEETDGDTSEAVLSEQNNSGQSGTVLLVGSNGTTHVTIDATALVGSQPAHIHSGTCADLGGVVYPLNNVEGGSSETVVDVSLAELVEGSFAINLHLSAAEIDVYTACANIN